MKMIFIICFMVMMSACATMQQYREQFVKTNPELTAEQKNAILNGELSLGMTPDMVSASWGYPVDITKEILGGQRVTTWIYQIDSDSRVNTYRVRFDSDDHLQEVKLVSVTQRVYSPYHRRNYWRHYPEYP